MFALINDYANLEEFSKASREILLRLFNNRNELRNMILSASENVDLLPLCVRYNAVDKLVLWNSEDQKMQLRLHVYSGPIENVMNPSQISIKEIHNHRWNFSSIILFGGYLHTIYGIDRGVEHQIPVMVRYEGVGACYTIHHSQYHSIIEDPGTVTLIFRGPLEKERFQIIQGTENSDESLLEIKEEKNRKTISREQYGCLIDKLAALGVI